MKLKFGQSLIFLFFFVLVIISQRNVAFSVIPGWHTIIIPPAYLFEIGVISISLIGAIGGYAYLSIRNRQFPIGIFMLHVLLTIPIIIAFFYNSINADFGSLAEYELNKQFSRSEWIGYLLITVFITGQLLFWWAFTMKFHSKTKGK